MERVSGKYEITVNGCWDWIKSCSSSGYGQLTVDGRYWSAHRYSYHVTYGDLGSGDIVRHLCHNVKCMNPEHLKKGTQKDNWYDSEDVHRAAQKKKRLEWLVDGVSYPTFRKAVKGSGISSNSLNKYTDKVTRVFDVQAYREACKVAKWTPKI